MLALLSLLLRLLLWPREVREIAVENLALRSGVTFSYQKPFLFNLRRLIHTHRKRFGPLALFLPDTPRKVHERRPHAGQVLVLYADRLPDLRAETA